MIEKQDFEKISLTLIAIYKIKRDNETYAFKKFRYNHVMRQMKYEIKVFNKLRRVRLKWLNAIMEKINE